MVSAVTLSAPDNPPSAPTGLAAVASGSSGVNLSWTAATDDLGVSLYEVERCQGAGCSGFVQVVTTAATSLADVGLQASTSYSYRVRARDTAAQVGPYSNVASATTAVHPATAVRDSGCVVRVRRRHGRVGSADPSGNGNIGTIQGAAWTTAGKFGKALSFNGADSTGSGARLRARSTCRRA